MIWIRESFGAKLLSALLGTVLLLTGVMFLVVRLQMNREVESVEDRTIRNAGTLFGELDQLQRNQAALLARPFSDIRARALLSEAIRTGDAEYLVGLADYEVQLQELDDVLLVFTDASGEPVLSMVGDKRILSGDPADVIPMAAMLLDGDAEETTGIRVVDGRMYNVQSIYMDDGFRPIGTITFGLPIEPADVERIGSVGGFQACFYANGGCVVQTPGVDSELGAALLSAAGSGETLRTEAGGREYLIRSEPLAPDDPERGLRIVAVPLDVVLAPFVQIQRALLLGGGFALLLAALLGAALSRSLARPVRDLVAAAGRVADGDYEAEVIVDSSDEMGTLAAAFNDMTRGLLLREQYRAVLNKVVSQDVAEELLKGEVELGGENREVSVLFADIRGFTPMTEGMEPQKVIGLLNDCMEHLSRAVDAEGGVVDKFIGDELMAVFGAPVTQSDHARRAVRAAIRMREGVVEMNAARAERDLPPLGLGIGINSGVAVAGNMGSADRLNYTVLGETVNLAARLVDQAGSGEVFISEETMARAGHGLVAARVGDVELKGFSSRVQIFAVESWPSSPSESSSETARAPTGGSS